MSAAQLKIIEEHTQKIIYNPGDYLIHMGQKSVNIFFLIQGDVSVRLHHENESDTRIATFSGGMFFGEMVLPGHRRCRCGFEGGMPHTTIQKHECSE